MRDVINRICAWVDAASKSGVTAIEYGLIAALIAVAIIVSVTLVGTNLRGLFTYIAGKVAAP
jgi:pilus assembly protein Flp/PilA